MKALFKLLKDCTNLSLSIMALQKKKNKSPCERAELKWLKEIMQTYLKTLKKLIEENENKNIED